ncbi:MAG: hypothetical protein ABI834_07335 [Ginsengibacter sp.]
MNINRNNYEEYFLLYADNELTDFEKAEVLMFVKQNKDLEEEFRMIHYTISRPDVSVELADKSFLLKEESGLIINEKNYEEAFILFHDNELTDKQKKETENFLSRHPQFKNEFELIGLAKLIPEDEVILSNKKKLYRKEKSGKVIPVIFWRALVAALLIGFGLWITQLYIQKGKQKPAVTVRSIPAKQNPTVIEKNNLSKKKIINPIVQSSGHSSQPFVKEINHEKEKLQKSLPQKNINNNVLVKINMKTKTPDEDLINQVPEKTAREVIVANEKIKNISKKEIKGDDKIEPSKELAQNSIQTNVNVKPVMYAQTSSYVLDVNENSQNYVFYDITTEEFKKTKVGGFLKKVKRVIERNNPISRILSGDEKQVVSN